MPADPALKQIKFSDFTSGLWQRGSERDCPPNGLLELTDARPLRTGGLRAWARWETLVDTSVAATTFGLPAAKQMQGFNVFRNDFSTAPVRRYMMLAPLAATTANIQVLGSTSTATTVQGTYSTLGLFTSAAGMSFFPAKFVRFASTGSTAGTTLSSAAVIGGSRQYPSCSAASTAKGGVPLVRDYFHIAQSGSSDLGVYRLLDDASGIDVRLDAVASFLLGVYQGRLLRISRQGSATILYQQRLDWSDKFTDANLNASSNNSFVGFEDGGDVTDIQTFMPGDLALMKRETGWWSEQGDITSLIERKATNTHPSQFLTYGAATPDGIAYLTANEGVWAYNGGNWPQPLSASISGSPMTEQILAPRVSSSGQLAPFLGCTAFAGNVLFTPKGYIRDSLTGAWFVSSPLNLSPPFSFLDVDQVGARVYAARSDAAGNIQVLHTSFDESSMLRASSYSWTTPILDIPYSQVTLREIEYHLQTYVPGCRIAVTLTYLDNNGQPVTVTLPPRIVGFVGHVNLRYQLSNQGSINAMAIKVRTVLSAGTGQEAPTLSPNGMTIYYTESASDYRAS